MRAVRGDERVSIAVALTELAFRKASGIYPRVAFLSLVLALSTAALLWAIGEMLIDDARVGILFTIAMTAITASLSRDIYGVLIAVRLPARA